METGLKLFLAIFLEGNTNFHLSSRDFISLLEEFNAIQSLFLGRLIEFQRKMYLFYCQFNILSRKSPLRHWMNAFLNYDLHDISQYVRQLSFSLFITHLQLSSFKNDLDDFPLGLVCEEFVEVCLLGDGSMRCIFVDLFDLEYFCEVFFESVSPVEGLVSIAGDLKLTIVDLITNGCHIRHGDL